MTSRALALCNYRAQKVRQGALVSLFPAVQRRRAPARGGFSFRVSMDCHDVLCIGERPDPPGCVPGSVGFGSQDQISMRVLIRLVVSPSVTNDL
jgi:hypothetical protein